MELWILIPIFGILAGMFSDFLKFKNKQRQLGDSTHELEARVKEMREERERILRRLENLETIVTSRTWDAVQAGEPPPPPPLRYAERPAGDEPSAAARAESLARKLGV